RRRGAAGAVYRRTPGRRLRTHHVAPDRDAQRGVPGARAPRLSGRPAFVGAAEAASFCLGHSPSEGGGGWEGVLTDCTDPKDTPPPTRPARRHSRRSFIGLRANGPQAALFTPCLRWGGSTRLAVEAAPTKP